MRSIRSFVYVAFVLATMAIFSACAGAGVTEPTRVTQCETGSIAPTCLSGSQRFGPSAEVRLKMESNPSEDSPVRAQLQYLEVVETGAAIGSQMFSYKLRFNMDPVNGSPGGSVSLYGSDDCVNPKGDVMAMGNLLPAQDTFAPTYTGDWRLPYSPFNCFVIKAEYGVNGAGKKYAVGILPAR